MRDLDGKLISRQPNGVTTARGYPRINPRLRRELASPKITRDDNFVDRLIHSAAEMVEVIWPLETDDCLERAGVLPLETFIRENLRRSRCSYSALQVSLYYLIQIKEHVPDPETILQSDKLDPISRILGSGRRVFLSALILATKYLQDSNYSARAWSKISGLKVTEINTNEMVFLQAVNWKLYIPDSMWAKWERIFLENSQFSSDIAMNESIFSEWKVAVGSLTPDLNMADVGETTYGQEQTSWTPLPRVEFHDELERRSSLLKPLFGSASSAQSDLSELASRFSGLTVESITTSTTYKSTQSSVATFVTAPLADATLAVIHEEEQSTNIKVHDQRLNTSAYLEALQEKSLIPTPDVEVNWSGKGQHVEFPSAVDIPLEHIDNLGSSASAIVDRVQCRRIFLARKTMRCPRKWTQTDSLDEIQHLHSLRHAHIVQLVGTYVQNRSFAILMYPAADCDLRKFMEDTSDLRNSTPAVNTVVQPFTEFSHRLSALSSFPACLASALAFIHSHTTKHADIKPANVLVKHGPNAVASDRPETLWRVYIADFGLSRKFLSENSQTDGPRARTPKYCAPEVYLYESRGRAADVFSLGCVFTEILTVYAGFDLEDLREHLYNDGETDYYHSNIDRTHGWINKQISDGISPGPGKEILLKYVQRMLEESPEERPTAASIKAVFKLPLLPSPFQSKGEGCCEAGPEPYIAEGFGKLSQLNGI